MCFREYGLGKSIFCAWILGLWIGLVNASEIKAPLHPMDYYAFSQTLSGDPKRDMPRIRGIIARNLFCVLCAIFYASKWQH